MSLSSRVGLVVITTVAFIYLYVISIIFPSHLRSFAGYRILSFYPVNTLNQPTAFWTPRFVLRNLLRLLEAFFVVIDFSIADFKIFSSECLIIVYTNVVLFELIWSLLSFLGVYVFHQI